MPVKQVFYLLPKQRGKLKIKYKAEKVKVTPYT